MATEEEIRSIQELFKLYNLQYINDIVLSVLELIYYVLQIVAAVSDGSSISKD